MKNNSELDYNENNIDQEPKTKKKKNIDKGIMISSVKYQIIDSLPVKVSETKIAEVTVNKLKDMGKKIAIGFVAISVAAGAVNYIKQGVEDYKYSHSEKRVEQISSDDDIKREKTIDPDEWQKHQQSNIQRR